MPNEKRWNLPFIHNIMIPSHMEAVLNVPLFDAVSQDSMYQWPNKDGKYSVKSAYNIFMERVVDLSHHYHTLEYAVETKGCSKG